MAEPLSLAASVAGIVSLGIQVTTGISKYLDAVESRDEELRSAKQQNEALENTIAVIEKVTAKLEPTSPDAAATARQSLVACKDRLKSLKDIVAELTSPNGSTLRSRLKSSKFHYVFDRPKVQQLSVILGQTNSAFQLALEGLGLSTAAVIHETVAGIQGRIPGLENGITSLRNQQLVHHQASTQCVVENTTQLSNQIACVQNTSNALVHVQQNHFEKTWRQNSDLTDKVTDMQNMVQAIHALILDNHADDGLPDDDTLPSRAVARLAAKPAAFGELCGILPPHGGLEATPSGIIDANPTRNNPEQSNSRQGSTLAWNSKTTASCICGRKLQTKMSLEYSQLGSLYLYREATSTGHSPYCPLYKTIAPKEDRRYGLRYTGLMQAIKGAIDITFNMTSGAGGWSVSPGFRYYPTVDAAQDPAFRILDLYGRSFDLRLQREDLVPDELITVFHHRATEKMRWLFDTRKTSPLAVDDRNRSLMHEAFDALKGRDFPRTSEFIRMLLDKDVPPISYDTRGQAAGLGPYFQINEALMIIAEADGGAMPLSIGNNASPLPLNEILGIIAQIRKSMPLAEALGCGPLSIAVLQGDKHGAKSLLERCPKAVAEKDLLGHTPLQMAVYCNNLPSFPFLLEAAKTAHLLQEVDYVGKSVLRSALDLTSQICCNSDSFPECTNCRCSDSLAVLLDVGAALLDRDLGMLRTLGPYVSARAWRVFFGHIKDQREQLRQVMLRNQWAIGGHYGLMEETSVLDLHASTIYNLLLDNGVGVPMDLVLSADDTRCVYQLIPQSAQLAEMLFQMGFRDFDFDIQYGLPPITRASRWDYIYWLIQRGTDLRRRIWPVGNDQYETSGIFSAHFAMFNLGDNLPYNFQDRPNPLASAIARVLPLNLTDYCSCQCSVDGCTPFIYMLKGICSGFREPWEKEFMSLFPGLPLGIIKSLYLSAARFECFEYLDLTHTCCNAEGIIWSGKPYVAKDPGEVEEIQQEESALLSLLDEMVDELAGRVEHITGDPAQLQACWQEYWEDYAYAVLEKLENSRMTEEERQSAEMIGVVWKSDTEPAKRSACDDGSKGRCVEDEVKRLFRELDSIGGHV
ncbi:hypothetical protein PG984_007229 [Apiospora sp. TS-2023a]